MSLWLPDCQFCGRIYTPLVAHIFNYKIKNLYIYVYIYIYVCVCVYIYIYIYQNDKEVKSSNQVLRVSCKHVLLS